MRLINNLEDKLLQLEKLLTKLDSVLVAYSGGVDSTFLASMAHKVLSDRMLAVIAASPTYPQEEIAAAEELAANLGFSCQVIQTHEMDDPAFAANDPLRCYYCKAELFGQLKTIAATRGLKWVADGSNYDDLKDYRPGRKAVAEAGVRSPLCEVGLTKAEIRSYSRKLGLPTWDKPSLACLSSRIPYGTRITSDVLARIAQAESYLHRLGIRQVRVRHHGNLARIEVEPQSIALLTQSRQEVAEHLKALGYTYVTVDLLGYRTGSMNEALGEKP